MVRDLDDSLGRAAIDELDAKDVGLGEDGLDVGSKGGRIFGGLRGRRRQYCNSTSTRDGGGETYRSINLGDCAEDGKGKEAQKSGLEVNHDEGDDLGRDN